MKTWFTADTHFGQQRTLELSRRPFTNINVMDHEIVGRWNSVVTDQDTVFHLGDFGRPDDNCSLPLTRALNGNRIVLVPGNYDDTTVLAKLREDPRVEVWPQMSTFQDHRLSRTLYLIHEPERATDPNKFYLYGHIHQLQMVKRNGLNVGVDCHQFTPIDLSVVQFYIDAIAQHYDHNVFVATLGGDEDAKNNPG